MQSSQVSPRLFDRVEGFETQRKFVSILRFAEGLHQSCKSQLAKYRLVLPWASLVRQSLGPAGSSLGIVTQRTEPKTVSRGFCILPMTIPHAIYPNRCWPNHCSSRCLARRLLVRERRYCQANTPESHLRLVPSLSRGNHGQWVDATPAEAHAEGFQRSALQIASRKAASFNFIFGPVYCMHCSPQPSPVPSRSSMRN